VSTDVLVLFEHPEWQKPLFAALERRKVRFEAFDLKTAAFDPARLPEAKLVFNQASPSAYVRGHGRAVPLAMTLMRSFEAAGVPVLNGTRAFGLELSKAAQVSLLHKLGLKAPASIVFNDADTLTARVPPSFRFPALLKPDQGGSGARMFEVKSVAEVNEVFRLQPEVLEPDPIFLLQEKLPLDPSFGIVRMEIIGGELLYAMRVVSHGGFNLCPSEICHPVDGTDGVCEVPVAAKVKPVEFYAYPEVPKHAVEAGQRLVRAAGLDVAGLEYVAVDGEPVFYDINANSNLRPAVAAEYGFDPFERVVDFLEAKLRQYAG